MVAPLEDALPAGPLEADQHVVLYDVSWDQYVGLRRTDERPGLRMTYLEGTLEIMTLSIAHEDLKTRIARLIEIWAIEVEMELDGYGSTTYRSKAKKCGLEPDECYVLGGKDGKRRPDIAIEVNLTSGGVDKLAVYRGLAVPEVWMWERGVIMVYRLGTKGYAAHKRSTLLPDLDLDLLAAFAGAATTQTRAVLAFREAIRARKP